MKQNYDESYMKLFCNLKGNYLNKYSYMYNTQ